MALIHPRSPQQGVIHHKIAILEILVFLLKQQPVFAWPILSSRFPPVDRQHHQDHHGRLFFARYRIPLRERDDDSASRFRRRFHHEGVVSKVDSDTTSQTTTTTTTSPGSASAPTSSTLSPFNQDVQSFLLFFLHSVLLALTLVCFEDYACLHTLPSRSRVSLPTENLSWGQSTVRGMGFGERERSQLLFREGEDGEEEGGKNGNGDRYSGLLDRPSYNEVMLRHRRERVPRWREERERRRRSVSAFTASAATAAGKPTEIDIDRRQGLWHEQEEEVSDAIHTLCRCLQTVFEMQDMAKNYQWEDLRKVLQEEPRPSSSSSSSSSSPLLLRTDMEVAASRLRTSLGVIVPYRGGSGSSTANSDTAFRADVADDAARLIGFDWGSCAWRHCGALADAQEAMDELEHLLGVLEPYEALFCLDVVERSLRDILSVVPWDSDDAWSVSGGGSLIIRQDDRRFWHGKVPPYRPLQSHNQPHDSDGQGIGTESGPAGVDEEYAKALLELRID